MALGGKVVITGPDGAKEEKKAETPLDDSGIAKMSEEDEKLFTETLDKLLAKVYMN